MTSLGNSLGFDNPTAEILRKMELAPNTMLHYELLKNAYEAYLYTEPERIYTPKLPAVKEGEWLIDVRAFNPNVLFPVADILADALDIKEKFSEKKWSIFNFGNGMSPTKLRKATMLASSGPEKINSIDHNHGEGAKITGFRDNNLGIIYVSCHKGRVSLAWVYVHNLITGGKDVVRHIFGKEESGTEYEDILDITDLNWKKINADHKTFFTLEHDWTMVILLGNRADQNTAECPRGPNKAHGKWFAKDVVSRTFRLPSKARIRVKKDAGFDNGTANEINFVKSYEEFLKQYAADPKYELMYEVVTDEETNIKVHYIYDPLVDTKQGRTSLALNRMHLNAYSGIIYKNATYSRFSTTSDEDYGIRRWATISQYCGITSDIQRFRMLVELPDSMQIIPKEYRTAIAFKNTSHREEITFTTFLDSDTRICDVVRRNMPQWMIDKQNEANTAHSLKSSVSERLKQLSKELLAKQNAAVLAGGTIPQKNGPSRVTKINHNINKFIRNPSPYALPAKKNKSRMNATGNLPTSGFNPPTVQWCTTKEDWLEKGGEYNHQIANKAAWYDRENEIIFLNLNYPDVQAYEEQILQKVVCEHEEFVDTARAVARDDIAYRIGAYVTRALCTRNSQDGWGYDDVSRACVPETLTILCRDTTSDDKETLERLRELKKMLENKVG